MNMKQFISLPLIVSLVIAYLLPGMSVLAAEKNSAADCYFRMEGAPGVDASMTSTPTTGGYYTQGMTSGNYAKYSTDAAYAGATGVEIYDAKSGSAAEFNFSLTAAYVNGATFDPEKTYRFQFYAKVNRGAFLLELIQTTSPWGKAMGMSSNIENTDWMLYEFTIGPSGVKGVDYPYNSMYTDKRMFFRFKCASAIDSILYLDEVRFSETDPANLVRGGDLEHLALEGKPFEYPNWTVDGGDAVWTSEAAYRDSYGVTLDGAGGAKLNCSVNGFDKTKKYLLSFYAKTPNENFEAYLTNSSGTALLASAFPIAGEKYYNLLVGPEGSAGVHLSYDPRGISDNDVVLSFRQKGTAGKMDLDHVSFTEASDDKLVFKADSINFKYNNSSSSPQDALIGAGELDITLSLSNNTIYDKKAELIAALYDADGKLRDFAASGTVAALPFTENNIVSLTYVLPANVEDKEIKLYIWDGIDGQLTLCGAAALPGKYTLDGTILSQAETPEMIAISRTPVIDGGVVQIEAQSPKGSGKAVNLVVKKDADSSIVYMGEKISDSKGKALFEFPLDDSVLKNDCTAYFGGEDALQNSLKFFYFTNEQLQEVLKEINETSFASAAAIEASKKILFYAGLDFTLFEQLVEAAQNTVAADIDANKPVGGYNEASLKNAFNDYAITAFVSKIRDLSLTQFKEAFVTYAQNYFSAYENDDWVYEKLKNGQYTSQSGIQARLTELTALYKANNAAYVALPEILRQNEETLGLKQSSRYVQYKGMKDDDKDKISKEFVSLAAATPFDTPVALRSAFDKAYDNKAPKNERESNPGSGPGRGGAGGSTPEIKISDAAQVLQDAKPAYTMKFSDLDGFDWAVESINELYLKGILSGENENEFKPKNPITREEFVKLLIGVMNIGIAEEENNFTDVGDTAWYRPYVVAAKNAGIINGVTEDTFGVGVTIIRQDMAVMLYRALLLAGRLQAGDSAPNFADADEISDYALEAVAAMSEYGIVKGYGDNTFAPGKTATRAEAAVMIYRLYQSGGAK